MELNLTFKEHKKWLMQLDRIIRLSMEWDTGHNHQKYRPYLEDSEWERELSQLNDTQEIAISTAIYRKVKNKEPSFLKKYRCGFAEEIAVLLGLWDLFLIWKKLLRLNCKLSQGQLSPLTFFPHPVPNPLSFWRGYDMVGAFFHIKVTFFSLLEMFLSIEKRF